MLTTSLIYFSDYVCYVLGVFGTESVIKIQQEHKDIFSILNLDCMRDVKFGKCISFNILVWKLNSSLMKLCRYLSFSWTMDGVKERHVKLFVLSQGESLPPQVV